MKSNKQRRLEIKTKRRQRAEVLKTDPFKKKSLRSRNIVIANPSKLAHNNTYGPLPLFYTDKTFTCKNCKTIETWSAKSQKWWYETIKGNIDSTAIHCLQCRINRRKEKQQQRIHMIEMAKQEPHPHAAFFKKQSINER